MEYYSAKLLPKMKPKNLIVMRLNLLCFILFFFSIHCSIAQEKPNVLFIMADDLNTSLSGFGHAQCKTPNLDRLASKGVIFQHMYCQYPVCSASRASLMTGLYPYSNGMFGNAGKLRDKLPDVVTLAQLFKNNGYYAARVSKIYHMNIPSDIINGYTEHDDSASWDEAINVKAEEYNMLGVKTNWSPKNTKSQAFVSVAGANNDLLYADGQAADETIRLLEQHKDKPLFLAVGFVRPHVPLVAPERLFNKYEREKMIAPVVPKNDLDDVPEIIRGYKSNNTYGVTPELHKGLLQSYYASVSYMDEQVGKVLKALDDNGLSENTIVVFTSDHGYLLGEHNKFQKQHLFEESLRIPFIVSVPWLKTQNGEQTYAFTELVDLYPTLADLAGLEAPAHLQGKSMKSLLEDTESKKWNKELVFSISRSGGESIRTKDWRYTHWGFGAKGVELYDLNNDPREFTNLAGKKEYADIQERLKKMLLEKRNKAGFKTEIAEKY